MFLLYSIIKHVKGAVSITPLGEAKTYVNGKCISGPTFLHHVSGLEEVQVYVCWNRW